MKREDEKCVTCNAARSKRREEKEKMRREEMKRDEKCVTCNAARSSSAARSSGLNAAPLTPPLNTKTPFYIIAHARERKRKRVVVEQTREEKMRRDEVRRDEVR